MQLEKAQMDAKVKEAAAAKKNTEKVLTKASSMISSLEATVSKATFNMVPEMIADPVREGLKRLKGIIDCARRVIEGDAAVYVPDLKDLSAEMTLLKKAHGLSENVMTTMSKM